MEAPAEIRVVRCGGSSITFRKAVFTLDSKFLLCPSGDAIKVFSTSTEECVHVLQGHANLITGIVLNPSNHLQVYSCSLDGTVKLWDFTDGILIKTYVVGPSIFSILVSKKHDGVVFLVMPMASNKSREAYQLVALHLPRSPAQEVEAKEMTAVTCDISPLPKATSFGREGEYIASAKGVQLSVYFFRKQKEYRFFLNATDKKGAKNEFTCVSCHPKDDCIATGHADGKIRLWRNFNQKKEYTYSTEQWHHSAVAALTFSPQGTKLLSGGIESVLVQWHYGTVTKKDFLPRLGGAIEHISVSPDGALYCTSHKDNKVIVIQSNLKVSAIIQGLVKGDAVRTELLIDPRTKALVLNGKPGHLQFYSLHRDKQLYNLDIVQQEYIHESGLQQYEVVRAALDSSGAWLATVEERAEEDGGVDVSLKLWTYSEAAQSFQLNTTICMPHEGHICSMCFCDADETTTLVTTGRDGHFKAWVLVDDTDAQGMTSHWSCEFVGGYHHLTPSACCFSADGSLLAVGFREVVTVWLPGTWELLVTFSQPPGDIRDLCFGRLGCSKFLLGTTTEGVLCCWNLLTCSVEWSTALDVTLLQPDPLSENMAAFSATARSTDLFVFKPSEPRPQYSQKSVCLGEVRRAVFAPRQEALQSSEESAQWLNRSRLYFLTDNMDLMTFSIKSEEDRILASSKQLVVDDSVALTPFCLLLGKHRQAQRNKQDPLCEQVAARTQLPQRSTAVLELLHTPAHVLPPASHLCTMFVNSLLISKPGVRGAQESEEEDLESEKEEEMEESEEEMELRDAAGRPAIQKQAADGTASLSTSQERELQRLRKADFSWVSAALHS
ncbi:WD repeat-containing protein 75 [Brienomyrus brachyistius]|uniref:WD repeat-containing protein 75 n=1 Tax=Brienomyrus brachyistius TaxID=42636 RepID=UPI0020B457A6|nr:WD repeat-containing protein 75 [Brienomyrus brachyistius]